MKSRILLRAAHVGATLTFTTFLATFTFAPAARATNVTEFPDNGSEQMGRGGAWIARASDPLAAYFNPAGLAGQETAVTLQANVSFAHPCMTRTFAANDTTNDRLVDPGHGVTQFPRVCANTEPFPNPQLGFTWRVTDRIGIGLLPLIGPSSVGKATWPETIDGKVPNLPSPQRYLMIESNLLFITPTVGAGFEVIDGLRLGASFQWGIAAKLHLANATAALNGNNQDPGSNDVRAQVDAHQLFIPGFTLGGIWSATDSFDVAGTYKWSAPIDATGDVLTYANYFNPAVANGDTSHVKVGDTSLPDCGLGNNSTTCGNGGNATIKVPIPMEAKLGFRYHKPRRIRPPSRRSSRDPIHDDVFDAEVNFTWANNSAFDAIELRFPSIASSGNGLIPVNGIPGGVVPPNADVPKHFRDVVGVRIGGDYNVLPDQLAVRAGVFYETRGQDPQYQNIDISGAERYGLSLGGTYRIRMGSAKQNALEFMVGYGHVFYGTQDNPQPGSAGIPGVAGTLCNDPPGSPPTPSGPTCNNGNLKYRTNWPVNLGTITNSVNVINVGASYRF